MPGIGALLQVGLVCGVAIGAGTGLGLLLDGVLGTSPLLVLVGMAVGILAAAAGSYAVLRPYVTDGSARSPRSDDRDEPPEP
jgi:F0F1-type ATP synthase assembly protein I